MVPPCCTTTPLAQLPILLLDAQATAANPATGALVEIGWARGTATVPLDAAVVEACVVAPPPGTTMLRAVARITGIRPGEWERGIAPAAAWGRLLAATAPLSPPVPLVVHFARFEEPHLHALHERHGSAPFPFELICTHAIARRLLPGLPRCTLRALAGYFGAEVPTLRRSADHVVATAFVWRHLVDALHREGIGDLGTLREWLQRPAPRPGRARRSYPLPRERRRELPHGPGIYRFLRAGGTVVYVGKATSLRQRVSGHFHAPDGERALELLSQVREVSCTETATALEAALLEADEIKRLAPPYNRALTVADRSLWFATADLCELSETPDERHTIGPLASSLPFQSLTALRSALATALPVSLAVRARAVGVEPAWAPDGACFADGCARFVEAHGRLANARAVLRLGARLWEGRRAANATVQETAEADTPPATPRRSQWDAQRVLAALEETVLRSAHAVRRARWLLRLSESSLVWTEAGREGSRLIAIEGGTVTTRADLAPGATAAVPVAAGRSAAARRAAFDLACFDRLRVLTTELRTLTTEAPSLELRLGAHVRLSRQRLETVLRWV
jgi:DNA polymerase III subunit epsilon